MVMLAPSRKKKAHSAVAVHVKKAIRAIQEDLAITDPFLKKVAMLHLSEYLLAEDTGPFTRFENAADRMIDLRLSDREQLFVIQIEDGLDIAYASLQAAAHPVIIRRSFWKL